MKCCNEYKKKKIFTVQRSSFVHIVDDLSRDIRSASHFADLRLDFRQWLGGHWWDNLCVPRGEYDSHSIAKYSFNLVQRLRKAK